MSLPEIPKALMLQQQRAELTAHTIYKQLAEKTTDLHNKAILEKIASDELRHHNFWMSKTGEVVKPNSFQVKKTELFNKVFGPSFTLKLLERGELEDEKFYEKASKAFPQVKEIKKDEIRHESKLISLMNDEKLNYAGAVVLGLNDALVELTGTLAGLTLAIRDTSTIALTGLILGFAASLSMAASGYLSSKEEEDDGKNPITSAIYTGITYVLTVVILIAPYFFFSNVFLALAVTLALAVSIIAFYTFYISVAKSIPFTKRFLSMTLISATVAALSFVFGSVIKVFFGV